MPPAEAAADTSVLDAACAKLWTDEKGGLLKGCDDKTRDDLRSEELVYGVEKKFSDADVQALLAHIAATGPCDRIRYLFFSGNPELGDAGAPPPHRPHDQR